MTVGDMTGDGKVDFLFFDGARSVKAFDHDGNPMWEKFNPDEPGVLEPYHNYMFQIYDIDRDGQGEAIIFWWLGGKYCVAIVDGSTGAVEESTEISFGPVTDEYYKKHSVAVANLRGLETPQDILAFQVHTMEINGYAYTENGLQFLWHWKTDHQSYSAGRWAYPYDIDGDGRDEVIGGIDVLDENGNRLWKLPKIQSHPDAVVCGDIDGNRANGKEIVVVEDGGGMYMYDARGTIIWEKQDLPSQPQEIYMGNFRSDAPGLELLVFAENMNDYVCLYDMDGNILAQGNQGNGPRRYLAYQMDWDGDRSLDEIYTRTGIFDGYLNRLSYSMDYSYRQTVGISEFPPIVADLQGDHREEVIWYDDDEVIMVYNSDPLSVDALRSPWNYLEYRLRYANSVPCNAMYFDWTALGGKPVNDPAPQVIGGSSSGGGCFIATAAWGSSLQADIKMLRCFRDKYLLSNGIGRRMGEMYYKFGPIVAEHISKHESLKLAVRAGLYPLIIFTYLMFHTTLTQKILTALLLFSLVTVSVIRRKRTGVRS
jgi:hypothetical protein